MNKDLLVQYEGRLPVHNPSVLVRFSRAGRRAANWLADGALMMLVIVGLVGVGVLFARAAIREEREKEAHRLAWMAECRQDRKNYECEAMWRAVRRAARHHDRRW